MDVKAQARRNLELDLRNALATNALRGPLPAAAQPADQADLDLRGAAALAASGARHDLAGRVHPGRRGDGPDRRDRRLRAARGLPGVRAAGRATCASRSTCRRSSSGAATSTRVDRARRWPAPGWPPSRLEIEITESVFLQDTELTRALAAAAARDGRARSRSTISAPAIRA